MHVLHLTPYYAPAYSFGGVTRSVEGMAQALSRRGHRVTVLTTDAYTQTTRYTQAQDEVLAGIQVVRARNLSSFLRGSLNLSIPYSIRKLAETLLPDVDVLHCHEFRTVENLLVTPLAQSLGKPIVLSPHGTLSLQTGRSLLKTNWDRLFSPSVAERVQQVIGLSLAELDEVKWIWSGFGRGHPNLQFAVVPNGVDPEQFEHLSGRAAFRERFGLGDAVVCLFMGRLHERKGVHLLVEAFRLANIPNSRLVIAGPDEGMLERLQPLLDERVVITGYLDGADRLAAYAASDLLALPARGEGLPMVVLEAMASGLPVLVSPGCNIPEVHQSGAGMEVVAEVEPLLQALRSIMNDAAKRGNMALAARTLVQESFTWDSVASKLEGIYERLIK